MSESQETQARNNVGCVIRLVGRCDVNGANFMHAPPNKATQVDYQFQPRGPPLTYSSYREHAAKQNTLFFIGTFTLWGRLSFGCSRQVQDEHGKGARVSFLILSPPRNHRLCSQEWKRIAHSLLALKMKYETELAVHCTC